MYYTNNGTPDFYRMNRETRSFAACAVDRFNPSTRGNYTYSQGNPTNAYLYCNTKKTGRYLGNGRYVEE